MPDDQLNIEYFFRLLYELVYGNHATLDYSSFVQLLSHIWLWVVVVSYAVSFAAFLLIVYVLKRLFDLRKREEEFYGTLLLAPEQAGGINPRWSHIESLMGEASPSAWREAVVEADILLDDMLTRQGYRGESVGEKLKGVERSDFGTLDQAWEAHKVRNQIAHQGSSFELTQDLAQRTIARYEAVFREFGAI